MCESVGYNTGLSLYGLSRFQDESEYLSCFECEYTRYVKEGKAEDPVACEACVMKWDGCSSCEIDGQSCERCY